jgi:hypothetical protein
MIAGINACAHVTNQDIRLRNDMTPAFVTSIAGLVAAITALVGLFVHNRNHP